MRSNKNALPVSQARGHNTAMRLVNDRGDINAADTKELISRLLEISSAIAAGTMVASEEAANRVAELSSADKLKQMVDAWNDRQSNDWAELGAAITSDIFSRVEREMFMRTVLKRGEVEQGSVPRIRVRQKNVTAIISRGPVQTYPQYVRDAYVSADEYLVAAVPRVEEIELLQGSADILDDKYYEGLEAIFVAEDRTLVKALRQADGVSNDVTNFSGNFTPAVLKAVQAKIDGWRIPVDNIIMALDLLNDMTTGSDYSTWFDPISKWEIIQTGRIGRLLGLNILTDGYREPNLRVLDDGEFFVLGIPEYLGGYTDRGPVQSRAVDEFDKLVPARGWSMWEYISMAVGNARAVARGKRI